MELNKVIPQIEILKQLHDISYLDAIIMFCETYDFEVEIVAHLIKKDSNFKTKLQNETEKVHLLKQDE